MEKRVWRELVRVLAPAGMLTQADAWIMAQFCRAVAAADEARAELAKSGKVLTGPNGGQYQSPWCAIVNRADEAVRRLAERLGLDPAARGKMNVEPPPEPSDDDTDRFFASATPGSRLPARCTCSGVGCVRRD